MARTFGFNIDKTFYCMFVADSEQLRQVQKSVEDKSFSGNPLSKHFSPVVVVPYMGGAEGERLPVVCLEAPFVDRVRDELTDVWMHPPRSVEENAAVRRNSGMLSKKVGEGRAT